MLPDAGDSSWWVSDEPVAGGLIAKLPSYISEEVALEASTEVARRLAARGQPTVIVLDLYDVEDQDAVALSLAKSRSARVDERLASVEDAPDVGAIDERDGRDETRCWVAQ
jgi:hypothetical protein